MGNAPTIRFDEMPELVDRHQQLFGLHVRDLILSPMRSGGAEIGWVPVIVLESQQAGPMVWTLGCRLTRDAGRDAAVALLDGFVDVADQVRAAYPSLDVSVQASTPYGDAVRLSWDAYENRRRAERGLPPIGRAPAPAAQKTSRTVVAEIERRYSPADYERLRIEAKAARAHQGVTQRHVADKCGTSAATISLFERGTGVPPEDVVRGIARLFELRPPEPAQEADPPEDPPPAAPALPAAAEHAVPEPHGYDPEDLERWRHQLREERTKAQETQQELADRVGLTKADISRIERGTGLVGPAMVRKLSSIYELDDPEPSP